MPAWIWFVVALAAAAGGAALLWYDRARPASGRGPGRRDWAASKGWEFTDAMSSPPHAWRYGTLRGEGPRQAFDVATGAVPGPGGRRLGCVFDQEQDGETVGTVAAVRGSVAVPVAVELRLPESPRPDDDELDNLGQVGRRYAFVSNAHEGRRLLTREVTQAADRVGTDVPLVWAEDTWVLASIDPGADPERVEGLIQSLVEVSHALRGAVQGPDDEASGPERSATEASGAAAASDARPSEDDAPTAVVGRTAAREPASRPDRDRDRDVDEAEWSDDDELDDQIDRFAAGDADASPYAGRDRRSDRDPGRDGGRDAATHRDRPGEIPYDLEQDDPGTGTEDPPRREPRSSQGSTWRSGPFRGR